MLSISIVTLKTRQVNFGTRMANFWSIKASDGNFYDSEIKDWNVAWTVGTVLSLDPSQIVSKTSATNGKVYMTIYPPRGGAMAPQQVQTPTRASAPAQGSGTTPTTTTAGGSEGMTVLKEIFAQNKKILWYLQNMPLGMDGMLSLGELLEGIKTSPAQQVIAKKEEIDVNQISF